MDQDEQNHGSMVRALKQFLMTDRFFGQRLLPIPRSILRRPPAAHPSAPPATAETSRPLPVVTGDKATRLAALDQNHVRGCRQCRLCEGRKNTVFGTGDPDARLLFVGEGPGFDEDRLGQPFVGAAGELLTRMIIAMGLRRQEVYICNIVKCRPPNNRDPQADEILACKPYLFEQIQIVKPEVMVALGAPAAKTLLDTTAGIGQLRARFHDFKLRDGEGNLMTIPLMPTYHPAYLLRKPEEKGKTWQDLQQVMAFMGLPVPRQGQ